MDFSRRQGDKWYQLTPWRAAVVGCYICLIVYGIAAHEQQARTDRIAVQGRAAICVEVLFLENSLKVTRDSIKKHPDAPETPARVESADRLNGLISDIRNTVPGCPHLN